MFQLENPMSLTEIKECFDVTSPNVVPRIKELEKRNLIYKDYNKYKLTSMGNIMSKKLQTMVRLSSIIEEYGFFFNEHDIRPIPADLLIRIDELRNCKLNINSKEDITAAYMEVLDNISKSSSVMGISSIFDSYYPEFFLSIAQRGDPISIILTDYVYRKVVENYDESLQKYLKYDNARMYVIEDVKLAFVVTNTFLSISFYYKNGSYDISTNLINFEKPAIKWGEELFQYYKQKSKEIIK